MTQPGEAVEPRRASSVVVVRDSPAGVEVLMLRRTSHATFAPDRYVFPGGVVDPEDRQVPPLAASRTSPPGVAGEDGGVDSVVGRVEDDRLKDGRPEEGGSVDDLPVGDLIVAGARETCEEAALLFARRPDGTAAMTDDARRVRSDLAAGASFAASLRQRDLALDAGAFVFHDRWVTPEGAPRRFDTSFYYAIAPAEQASDHDRREVVDSVWVRPSEVLQSELWSTRLLPPTRLHLTLCEQGSALEVLATARARATTEPVRARLVPDGSGGTAVVVRPGTAPIALGSLPWREQDPSH